MQINTRDLIFSFASEIPRGLGYHSEQTAWMESQEGCSELYVIEEMGAFSALTGFSLKFEHSYPPFPFLSYILPLPSFLILPLCLYSFFPNANSQTSTSQGRNPTSFSVLLHVQRSPQGSNLRFLGTNS
jgi:hypothetical protein